MRISDNRCSKPLAVLLVNMTVDPVRGGGTAERTRQLAKFLTRTGHTCHLVTMTDNPSAVREELGLDEDALIAFRSLSKRFYLPLIRPVILWKTVRKAGIVHLMNHWTIINAIVFIIASLQKIPIVLCPAGALRIIGRSRRIKRLYDWVIGGRMIRSASGVIIVAENERTHFSPSAQVKSIQVIPNGIDPNDFNAADAGSFRMRFALPGNCPFILFMGRLDEIKGPDILLRAFIRVSHRIADYHLVFAGPDGGMQSELETIRRKAQLNDRIHFIGYVGGAIKSQAYHAADFLVIPSRQEAMSIVALEAGISGTPVLLTDACGFNDVARIGGGMVVAATVAEIANGIQHMAASDTATMGDALRRHVLAHFTWSEIVKKHLTYFRQLAL